MNIQEIGTVVDTASPLSVRCPQVEARGQDGRLRERGTLILDVGSMIRYCDSPAAGMFGAARSDLIGRPACSLIPKFPLRPGTPGYNVASCHFHTPDGQWRRFQALSPTGQKFEIEASIEHLKLPKAHQFLLGLRHPAEPVAHMNGGMARLQCSLDAREDMALITDRNGVIRYLNRSFEAVTGFAAAELLGKTPHAISSGAYDEVFYAMLWGTLRQGRCFSAVLTNRKKNGELYHQESAIRPFLDEYGRITHFVLTGQDISQRIEALTRLEHLAHHDYLTGLPNRALFLDRLGQARAHALRTEGRFALLYVDLDGFKQINDEAGHGVGDELLRAVSEQLMASVREEDTVARIGGDEFACILPSLSGREDGQKVCDKILAAVRQALPPNRQLPGNPVSASIGLALYPDDGQDEETLLEQADCAMYQAKSEGGDRWCCPNKSASLTGMRARLARWESHPSR
jgi:diguanylate cyclase (GGDEF)-like protein/PAS domain S-box-containing protein